MKGDILNINRIYGDPQLLALNNRVQYIKSRQSKSRLPFTTISSAENMHKNTSLSAQKSHLFINSNIATECTELSKQRESSPCNKERREKLKQMKSMQYLQTKENSQKYRMRITESRQKDLLLKRIKRKKVRLDEEQGRARLEAYEEDKIRSIRNTRSNRDLSSDKLEWKRIQLTRKLVQEQTRSLHAYQETLSYKSQLMRKIKEVIKEGG